jgi:hypothetical protein
MRYERSSGNVFADLGLSDPEKRLERSNKMIHKEQEEELKKINDIIDYLNEETDGKFEDSYKQICFLTEMCNKIRFMYCNDNDFKEEFEEPQNLVIKAFDNFFDEIESEISQSVKYLFCRKESLESTMEFYKKDEDEKIKEPTYEEIKKEVEIQEFIEGGRLSPQISCTISPEDKDKLTALTLRLSLKKGKALNTSTIIRALIRLGESHEMEIEI